MKSIVLFLLVFTHPIIFCFSQTSSVHFRVEVTDEFVSEIIKKYVSENQVDIKEKVITLRVEVGLKKVITITNEKTNSYKTLFTPAYYGVLDNQIVYFVFAGADNIFKRDKKKIIEEIDQLLTGLRINLSSSTNLNYSAPTWRIVEECDKGYRLDKDVTPFEFQSVPCGYSIIRDTAKLDSLKLIRK